MSDLHIESKIVKNRCEQERIYTFLADFRNFENLLPPDVGNRHFEAETCSFSAKGQQVTLNFVSKEPYDCLKIGSSGTPLQEVFLWVQLKKTEDLQTAIKLTLKADVNMFLKNMVEKPMKAVLDTLADRLAVMDFNR
ncbi:MAG TPA: hypothetical protein PLZ52_03540 [Bacteroidales bacterium]|nr:hypothetical protein [Bacteroidales bacterium]HOE04266.1 hypothetical protein [Bacteroidales bacterium]HQL71106.1 hypothetical protein [Bacteroidales bacterium]